MKPEARFVALVFNTEGDGKKAFELLRRMDAITERVVKWNGREGVWTVISRRQFKELGNHKEIHFDVRVDSLESRLFRVEDDGLLAPLREVSLGKPKPI